MPPCDAATVPIAWENLAEVQAVHARHSIRMMQRETFFVRVLVAPHVFGVEGVCSLRSGVDWTSAVGDGGWPRARQFGLVADSCPTLGCDDVLELEVYSVRTKHYTFCASLCYS